MPTAPRRTLISFPLALRSTVRGGLKGSARLAVLQRLLAARSAVLVLLTRMGAVPRTVLMVFSIVLAANANAAASFELPPPGGLASHEHHPGKIVWADLMTPDLAAAESF